MSVNSLGPLNVTGLIAKRDLPKQFEVPPDLKESFQKQLLEQDFAIGRQITCGVLQVNPNIGDKVAYNLKMLFEELGALAADTVPVRDSGEVSENSADDEDEIAEEVYDDSDLKEIFDELRGNKPLLSVQDLKDWGDVQDMIANNVIDLNDLEGAVQEVTGKPKGKALTITFEQFVEVVDMLQDAMEGMTTDLDEYDENDDDEDDEIINSPAMVKPIVATPSSQKIKLVLEKIPEDSISENEAKSAKADKNDVDPNMPRKAAIALDGFNMLKGENGKVSIKNLRASAGVLEMLEDGVVTPEQLDDIISSVAGDKKQVDFDLFFLIATKLDQTAEEGNLYLQPDGEEDDEDVEDDANEEDLKEVAKELFDELRGKDKKVSVSAFMAWGDVKDMIEDGLLTLQQMKEMVSEVAGDKKQLDFDQFYEIVRQIDEIAEGAEEEDDETIEEVTRELFDELRGKNDHVSVAAFKAWDDVKALTEAGLMSDAALDDAITNVLAGKKQIDFEHFVELINQLDELSDETEDVYDEADEDDEDVEDDANEEDLKEVAKELFDELRGKDKKVSVSAFMAWEDIKDMIKDGLLTKEEIKEMVSEVAGDKKQLDFDQFYDIVSQLDEIAEGAEDQNEDEDELTEEDLKEMAKELFDELRGKDKKVSVSAFMASEDIKDMIEDGLLNLQQMKEMVSEVAGDKKQLDFDQFYDIVSQLDEIAEVAEDDLMDEDDDVQAEPSEKGFGGKAALSSKSVPLSEQNGAFDEDDESEGDFEDMSAEEVDEMLREVFDELKGKKGKTLTMKAFKKWEDIEEMLEIGVIDAKTIDDLAEKVGVKKGGDIAYEQFKALVELLDEVAGEDDESEDMSPADDRINDEDERIELDSDDIGGDGSGEDDEMTPEEIESMIKDIFDTLKGSKNTVSVATFLTWDNIQDMKDVLDDETINILLEEVGANRNRKGDLTYSQFSDLINLLEETVSALGDGEGTDTIMDDEDMDDDDDESSAANVSATLEEREAIDAEISEERNERNVLDGIDDEGVDIIAKEIYESLKGESESLSVKAFLEWEDVSELIDQGIVKLSTVNLLIVEVGGAKSQTLTFDQFWQLVNLLEDASDAAADKVASGLDDSEDFDEDELEPSPEELEMMAKGIFDDLKNPKTGTVTAKKLKNWEGIKEVLDSGELSKGALNAAIKKVGAEKTNELDFKQFKELMDILEAAMDEGEMDEEPTAPVINASGKGFARAAEPTPVVAAAAEPSKAKSVPVSAAKAEKESEAAIITREIYEELVGTGKSLSVDQLREWEDMQEMIEDGSLKRSTLEKALVKVGSLATGDISLKQFMQLIDIIQGAVDDSNLKFEYEDDVKDKDFKTSKKSSVLGSEEEEEENWGDDESGGDFEELTEEEAAQQAFDELVAEGASTISLVDFLQWEDVQDLLEAGALSKDDLATAIENAGVSLELDGIAFDKVSL